MGVDMARDTKSKQQEQQDSRRKIRVYKGEMVPMRELNESGSIEGTFQGSKLVEITDTLTKAKKEVQRYLFRDDHGIKFVILGRFMLDTAMEEVFEREGGEEKCIGLQMRIERGEDSKLKGNRTMGNYQVSVWEN